MKRTLLFILFILFSIKGFSQAKTRTLPRNINMPNYDSFYPEVSGDGISMIFMSNFTESGDPGMMYTYKLNASSWEDPKDLPRSFNLAHLLFEGGYGLNFDGKRLYFTFKKGGGFGGYDVWYSKLSSGSWQTPQNIGKSINSGAHEGMPSISSSGEEIYFCRCKTMTVKVASDCEIMVSKIKGSTWQEAVALPSNINSYSPQAPKIMADGETLIFSSKKGGSADLYITRKQDDGSWNNPVPMSFVNTSAQEQFVSVAAKGRYLYHDVKTERGKNIEMLLIPEGFKGKSVMHVKGTVVDASTSQGLASTIKVYNVATRKRIVFKEIGEKGVFNFALAEGNSYDFSVQTKDNSYAYYSKLYKLDELNSSSRDEMKVELFAANSGKSIELGALTFVDRSADIDDNSTYELRRLLRLLKNNSDKKYELKVHRYDYFEDSVASLADLTEVVIDTTWSETEKVIQITDTVEVSVKVDSTGVVSDSTLFEQRIEMRDSVIMVPHFELSYTYHNDRTTKQANNLVQYLIGKGIPEDLFEIVTTKTSNSPPRGKKEIIVSIKIL